LKAAFVNNSILYLKRNNACTKEQEKIFKYTLESLYSFITKSLVILILSLFLRTFKITLLTLVLYSFLRGFTFGIHATKNIYCWIISISVYIIFPLLITNLNFSIYFMDIVYALGILAIILWAPSDTKARPLINKKKRIVNKVISLCLALSYILLSFVLKSHNFQEVVCVVLLVNIICICPFTYLIFKQPYRNYKKINMV
jgi:accessory gene regulator B